MADTSDEDWADKLVDKLLERMREAEARRGES